MSNRFDNFINYLKARITKRIPLIIGVSLLMTSIYIGFLSEFNKYDPEYLALKQNNKNLVIQNDSFRSFRTQNYIFKRNIHLLNENNYLINTDKKALRTLSITNINTNPCDSGSVNGCWGTLVTAEPGEIICVVLKYENDGGLAIQNLSADFETIYSESKYRFSCSAKLRVGHNIINEGSVSVLLDTTVKLKFIPDSTKWTRNHITKKTDGKTLIAPNRFKIGLVEPGEMGLITFYFVVDKFKP